MGKSFRNIKIITYNSTIWKGANFKKNTFEFIILGWDINKITGTELYTVNVVIVPKEEKYSNSMRFIMENFKENIVCFLKWKAERGVWIWKWKIIWKVLHWEMTERSKNKAFPKMGIGCHKWKSDLIALIYFLIL